jgi:hypothetical protein
MQNGVSADQFDCTHLAAGILQQAVADCVAIFFQDARPFIPNRRQTNQNNQIEIISREHNRMTNWLDSNQFTELCFVLNLDEDAIRQRLHRILCDPQYAQQTAAMLKLRFKNG